MLSINTFKNFVESFKKKLYTEMGTGSLDVWGHVKVDLDYGDKVVTHFEEKNLIVNTGKIIVLNSIYPTSSLNSLSYAKVGTGGAFDTGGLFLKTPLVTQTDLYTPLTTCSIGALATDTTNLTRVISAVLDTSQGNGSNINEVGFFAGDGTMFNIKTFPFIAKTSGFSINFQWTIGVA